jgi:hypothetical protein
VLAILFLPVMLAALAGILGLGHTVVLRYRLSQAADLAALAAVQCLDRAALADGELILLAASAESTAVEYVAANLAAGGGPPAGLEVDVTCHNAGDHGHPDRVTGKRHRYTTVCVTVRCRLAIAVGPLRLEQEFFGHADASAVPR